jgi:malic enzyme
VLRNAPFRGVKLIVVTDNQAILGIGDQGAGGIVIPIGKLAIYSAAAGIHPAKTLPISLDVGTDNETLLTDDLYLGWRQPRLRGEEYFSLVDEFVEAIGEVFPGVLLQWEDFQKANAFELLERYRDSFLSFNDDIQGTGATALAGIMGGCRAAGTRLADQRVAIVGGGAAGIGIADQLRAAFEQNGLSGDELVRAIAVLDSRGLIVDDRENLDSYKRRLAWPAALASEVGLSEDRSLANVVAAYRPTVLIGTSGQPGIFDEELVREMARHTERPIIMPFSNPTALSEAVPEDLVRWTEGRALIATGSPFAPLEYEGREYRFGQGNNALIFPGVGLGALVAKARRVSDRMFSAAAAELARSTTPGELATGQLYPSIHRLREVTRSVATAVIQEAGDEGVGRILEGGELVSALDEAMWVPEYPELVPV